MRRRTALHGIIKEARVRRGARREITAARAQLMAALAEQERLERALRESEARRVLFQSLKQEERAREVAEANLRAILEASPQPIIVLDLEGYVEIWNAAAEQTLGWSAEEIVGKGLPTIPDTEQDAANQVFYRLLAGETVVGMEVRRRRRDGSWVDLSISAAPLRDAEGHITRIVEIYADITERKQAERELEHLAHHDSLTGLPNRTLLQRRLEQAAAGSGQDGGSFALLLLDLDGFKEVNDTYGHHHGDDILREVAARLTHAVRDTDVVARLGGDEFAVLLLQAGTDVAAIVADKILAALSEPFRVEGDRVCLRASIGGAFSPAYGSTPHDLLRNADLAMYAAKRTGRGYAGCGRQDEQSGALCRVS